MPAFAVTSLLVRRASWQHNAARAFGGNGIPSAARRPSSFSSALRSVGNGPSSRVDVRATPRHSSGGSSKVSTPRALRPTSQSLPTGAPDFTIGPEPQIRLCATRELGARNDAF